MLNAFSCGQFVLVVRRAFVWHSSLWTALNSSWTLQSCKIIVFILQSRLIQYYQDCLLNIVHYFKGIFLQFFIHYLPIEGLWILIGKLQTQGWSIMLIMKGFQDSVDRSSFYPSRLWHVYSSAGIDVFFLCSLILSMCLSSCLAYLGFRHVSHNQSRRCGIERMNFGVDCCVCTIPQRLYYGIHCITRRRFYLSVCCLSLRLTLVSCIQDVVHSLSLHAFIDGTKLALLPRYHISLVSLCICR